MPRTHRIVIPGEPHHVTQRGNRRADVFFDPADRQSYCDRLQHYAARNRLEILAYCLMTNHVHLLAVPSTEDSMAKAIGKAHEMHARDMNHKYGWTGHLWGGRYYSSPLDDRRTAIVARYIELNPVRAGIVLDPVDYAWSSARAHCNGGQDPLLGVASPSFISTPTHWRTWITALQTDEDRAMVSEIRRRTSTGVPIGPEPYIERLESQLGVRLRRRPYNRRTSGSSTDDG